MSARRTAVAASFAAFVLTGCGLLVSLSDYSSAVDPADAASLSDATSDASTDGGAAPDAEVCVVPAPEVVGLPVTWTTPTTSVACGSNGPAFHVDCSFGTDASFTVLENAAAAGSLSGNKRQIVGAGVDTDNLYVSASSADGGFLVGELQLSTGGGEVTLYKTPIGSAGAVHMNLSSSGTELIVPTADCAGGHVRDVSALGTGIVPVLNSSNLDDGGLPAVGAATLVSITQTQGDFDAIGSLQSIYVVNDPSRGAVVYQQIAPEEPTAVTVLAADAGTVQAVTTSATYHLAAGETDENGGFSDSFWYGGRSTSGANVVALYSQAVPAQAAVVAIATVSFAIDDLASINPNAVIAVGRKGNALVIADIVSTEVDGAVLVTRELAIPLPSAPTFSGVLGGPVHIVVNDTATSPTPATFLDFVAPSAAGDLLVGRVDLSDDGTTFAGNFDKTAAFAGIGIVDLPLGSAVLDVGGIYGSDFSIGPLYVSLRVEGAAGTPAALVRLTAQDTTIPGDGGTAVDSD